jgi:hypothetical protein
MGAFFVALDLIIIIAGRWDVGTYEHFGHQHTCPCNRTTQYISKMCERQNRPSSSL